MTCTKLTALLYAGLYAAVAIGCSGAVEAKPVVAKPVVGLERVERERERERAKGVRDVERSHERSASAMTAVHTACHAACTLLGAG